MSSRMSDIAILRTQLQDAIDNGPPQDQLKRAVDYYYGRPRGDEVPGRSQVQSLDVADMIHAVMAQILPSFTQDKVCEFEPDGPGDDAMARLESDAVNKVLMEGSRGFIVFSEALKDALLLKNGIIKVYLADDGESRQVRVSAVDPLCFFVGASQDSVLLDGSSPCFERKEYSRGDLIGMGFSRADVEQIPSGDSTTDQNAYVRRPTQSMDPAEGTGWANERVTVWEGYSQLPDDDDASRTRLYRTIHAENVLLLKERAEFVPYAAGTAFIEPHRFWGLSLYDRLKTVQDAKTAIQRQWLDNLANCNNSRQAVNDNVHLDDALDSRPGGLIRIKGVGPVAEAITPIPSIDAGPAASAYLAYMDQVRADRGGAALQMASAEAQITSSQVGSMGVDRIYSVQEALAGMIARTMAETLLRTAFLLVHRLLRTELGETLTLRLADQWVKVDPAQWKPRNRINIKSGLSPGERSRKYAAATAVLQYQVQALQMGMDGVLVTLPNLYNALMDWCSAAELDAGEKYFTDPRSQIAQQGSQQKAQQGQMAQQMQMELTKAQLDLERMKLQLDAQKAQMETQFDYYNARLSAEVEEAKIVGAATADLNRIELEGRLAAAQAAAPSDSGGTGGSREAA